ncbi:unnamed protein product [Calypogeia fissa]
MWRKIESTQKTDNTEEHGDDVPSPQTKALSEESNYLPNLASPSHDKNALLETNVGREEQDTSGSILVP